MDNNYHIYAKLNRELQYLHGVISSNNTIPNCIYLYQSSSSTVHLFYSHLVTATIAGPSTYQRLILLSVPPSVFLPPYFAVNLHLFPAEIAIRFHMRNA